MISCKAPDLCAFEEEQLLIEASETLCSGAVIRVPNRNGLWVKTDFEQSALFEGNQSLALIEAQKQAMTTFQYCLGALRVWRSDFGLLREEWNRIYGYGDFLDLNKNASIGVVAPAVLYGASSVEQRRKLLFGAVRATANCPHLTNALVLNGRTNRSTADYYMIHELAEMQYRQMSGVEKELNVPRSVFKAVKDSACNLPPFDGGRHATQRHPEKVGYSLDEVRRKSSDLLAAWIHREA